MDLLATARKGRGRALRGGSWINNGRNVRAAYRNWNTPDNRNDNIGLRLALSTLIGMRDVDALRSLQRPVDVLSCRGAVAPRQGNGKTPGRLVGRQREPLRTAPGSSLHGLRRISCLLNMLMIAPAAVACLRRRLVAATTPTP